MLARITHPHLPTGPLCVQRHRHTHCSSCLPFSSSARHFLRERVSRLLRLTASVVLGCNCSIVSSRFALLHRRLFAIFRAAVTASSCTPPSNHLLTTLQLMRAAHAASTLGAPPLAFYRLDTRIPNPMHGTRLAALVPNHGKQSTRGTRGGAGTAPFNLWSSVGSNDG